MRNHKRIVTVVTAALCTLSVPAFAQEWNQWRGPNRDSRVTGFKAPAVWPEKLTRQWKIEVGEGHASPLVIGNRIYVFARDGENEVARCLDIATGKEIWRDSYTAPYTMNPAAQGHGKGPKSTPIYADGRLYTFGISGTLSCLDGKTGKPLWRHDFQKDFKAISPEFGTALSPVLANGLLIVHVGSKNEGALTAFDAKNGEVRWKWTGDGPSYASPLVAVFDGVRQVVTQTQKMCVSLDAATGKLLWSIPFTTAYEQNSVTPVLAGDSVIFAGLRKPTFAVRPKKNGTEWTAEKVWETSDVTMYMSTPVLVGNRLYGMSERRQGQMFSLDTATGKTLWTGEGRLGENASVWDAGSVIMTLTNSADLLVYKKDGDTLTQIAKYQVADSPTWASPAIWGNRLLVKDKTALILWEIPLTTTGAVR